jgi:pilus assembly protein CpaE
VGRNANLVQAADALENRAGSSPPGGNSAPVSGGRAFAAHMGRRHDVLLVTEDISLCEGLRARFAPAGLLSLRHLCGQLAELEENIAKAKLPDVLVADLTQGRAADLETLDRLKKSSYSKTSILAISNPLDQHIVRGLMLIRADDWLPAGSDAEEIFRSCYEAIKTRQAYETGADIKCTAFFPAHGGCGNTALAIEAAFLIGSREKQLTSTCLVDLNFQDGAMADYLDLMPAFEISELDDMSRRLDGQLLDVMLTRHSSGMAVFAPPRTPGLFIDISEGLIGSILGHLSEAFDRLIIDLPRHWPQWTDNVVWGSDRIFVVTGFTVPGLRQARFLADAIAAKASPKTDVSVIVNKFQEPLMGGGLARKDALSILGPRLGGFIPHLGGAVDDAINRGMALYETRAGDKIAKRLSRILESGTSAAETKRG